MILHLGTIAVLVVSLAGAAVQRTPRSVEDYACLFGGECPSAPQARRAPEAAQRFALAAPPVDLQLSFAKASATLTPAAMAEARVIASALNRPSLSSKRLRIEGHTDSLGSKAGNLRLSRRRADAVVAFLVRRGVARSRLSAQGYGSARPLPGTPASATGNRRVMAVILP